MPNPLDPMDQAPPPVIGPQPTPFTPAYGVVSADQGVNLGVVEFHMLTGNVVLFMTSEELRARAREFADVANRVDSTPIAVRNMPPGLLGPGGKPLG